MINVHHPFAWSQRPTTPAISELVERIESIEATPHLRRRQQVAEQALRVFARPQFQQ